jgi:hypothetical protein
MAHKSHEVPTSVCRLENVVVDFALIRDGDYPWLQFSPGALSAKCSVSASAKSASHWNFMHCQADWMNLGFSTRSEDVRCDAEITTPSLFITRSGDYSPFAMTHDWINTVLLMAVENVLPQNVQLILMDRMGPGFYSPVYQLAFSPAHRLLWYQELKQKYRGKKVCIKKMWLNVPARLSPVYNEDTCEGSPFYRVYRSHILRTFAVERTFAPEYLLVVTVIMRRNYATGHKIDRRIGNVNELTQAIRSISLASPSMRLLVNQVDFASMDFDQQLNVSRSTDVLVAMHGAGLVQMMFMHSWGGVFEFFCPEKPPSNFRYRQLAMKMELLYDSFSIPGEDHVVPIHEAEGQLARLVRKVASKKIATLGGVDHH